MAFVNRKISVTLSGTSLVYEPVIKYQWLEDSVKAGEIWSALNLHGKKVIDNAQREVKLLQQAAIREAEQEFWQNANQVLIHWDNAYQKLIDEVEELAGKVAWQAVEQLLADVSYEEKVSLLVKRLCKKSMASKPAKLLINSKNEELIKNELARRQISHWQVVETEELDEDELKLTADDSEFHVSLSLEYLLEHIKQFNS